MSLFNVCSKDLWGLFLKKLISKAKKYEIFGKGRTLMSFKWAEHVAKNPNVSKNDISLINKSAKNKIISLILDLTLSALVCIFMKFSVVLLRAKEKRKNPNCRSWLKLIHAC